MAVSSTAANTGGCPVSNQPSNNQLAAWAAEAMGWTQYYNHLRDRREWDMGSGRPSNKPVEGYKSWDPTAPGGDFWRFWDWLTTQYECVETEYLKENHGIHEHNAKLYRTWLSSLPDRCGNQGEPDGEATADDPRRALLLAWSQAEGLWKEGSSE